MKYNLISVFAWLLGLATGLFICISISSPINIHFDSSIDYGKSLTFTNIFVNNIKVVLMNIVGGLTFGTLTFINLFYNGLVFAFILKMIYDYNTSYYIKLLPHSIEIIAFIIGGAIGFTIGNQLFKHIFYKTKIELEYHKLYLRMIIAVFIVFISAIIETYVSPKI